MTTYPFPLVYEPKRWSLSVGAPDGEPVTLAELKAHLYVEHSDDDDMITAMGVAARSHVEDWTKRALVTQTRTLRLDRFPVSDEQVIELPGGNIQSVTSIQYQDTDNATQTLATSVYETDFNTSGGTGRINLKYQQEWPDVVDVSRGLPVVITYVAGWAASGSPADYGANVPEPIKLAIKMLASGFYEARESTLDARIYSNPAVMHLLSPWVVYRFR